MNENQLVKKVKNMVTGQVFDSLSQAARSCNISALILRNKILDSEHGRDGVVLGRYVFCFMDHHGKELSTIHQRDVAAEMIKRRSQDIKDLMVVLTKNQSKIVESSDDHRLTLRIPKWLLEKIDAKRKERVGAISRNLWILEKLSKELGGE